MNTCSFPSVVSIAGTDPSGGAGIQADIKAISATGSYAASIITAMVSQNTQGVQDILQVPPAFIRQQFESVFSDLDIHAVKIGMLQDASIIEVVFSELIKLKPNNVVFDPVMVAKGGAVLLDLSALQSLKNNLKGVVSLITPNLFEAEHLLGSKITTQSDMAAMAAIFGKQFHLNVLIKGGHLDQSRSPDVLYVKEQDRCHWFDAPRIDTKNTHGTGCSLSSAIASYLAQGFSLYEAVSAAKSYLTKAIQSGTTNQIGKGFGPIDHFYFLENRSL
ncbi:MAG: bifunctional hydroxymethylpyrimidine kinase/phosphomethylpyrimidine kinase [Legionella sp.]|nr:bifunctional hydroxymethylpyrimidine kinase/phosphomethylpyrimidine kinase [Legionella sp.]